MTTIDAQCASPMSQQPSAHTRSQLDVMMLLVRFPLLSVADLAFALGHSVAWTYGQMRALRAAGLAEPTSAPVCAPMCSTYSGRNIEGQMKTRVYAATLKGLEWIEAVSGSAVWRLATQTGADSVGLARLRRRLPAVLAVQSFVFALLRQIQQGTVALPRTDSKAERSRSPTQLMWDWVRDPVLRYRWRARSMTMHVDAAVQLQVCLEMDKQSDEESLHRPTTVAAHELAVLYDGGLAEARDLRRTLLQLMQCREALAEENRGRCLPPLLILTPDARRAALWQALALQLATERWLTHPLIGGAVAWPASGAGSCDADDASDTPDHIWHDHTWRSLAQATACDLASLLTTGATSIDLPNESALVECVTSRALQRVQRSANRRQVPQKAAHREALGATEMTARDLSVLQLLYAHPLLSAEELAAMLGIDPASSERYLRRLREAGLVTQRQFVLSEPALTLGGKTSASHSQQRYALTAQGFALVTICAQAPGWWRLVRVADDVGASATQRLRLECDARYQHYWRVMQLLARTPDHTAGVYGFFALLHATARTACQSGYGHALVWWETGRACMRRYREGAGWHAIWPDGAGEYRADGQRMRFWLEWDRGTMGRRDLIAKFAAYARYLRSREWRVDGNDPVPALLIVTSDVAQETRVTAALSAANPYAPGLPVSITSRDALAAQGPLAPIWHHWSYDRQPRGMTHHPAHDAYPLFSRELG